MKKTKTSKVSFKPTAGYVMIQAPEAQTKTVSGIYLPETNTEKPQKGKVLAVGDTEISDSGTKKISPVKVGDTVIYKKWGGNEVKIDNVEYLFVKFEDILAVEI